MRNFALDSGIATAFDTDGRINIYTGSIVSTGDTAATGTLLGTLTLSSDAFGAASSGAITAAAITSDTSADASGTAGYFIMYKNSHTAPSSTASGTDRRLVGTCGTSGADLNFDTVTFVAGGTIAVSSFVLTHPTG